VVVDNGRLHAVLAQEPEREVVDVVYLPYLPLDERIIVGQWELIPRAVLVTGDCRDARTLELAQGLAEVYVLPQPAGTAAGVFARLRGGSVGEEIVDFGPVHDLQHACIPAVLDANPSPLDDHLDPNAGHWILTSDNAQVVAHGIDRKLGYTGTIVGSYRPMVSFGVSVLDDPENHIHRATIPPPGGLRIPTFRPPRLDVEYADVTWQSIRRSDDAARRLRRAIEWLGLASRNVTGMTNDVRVPALRAGFEVLLDSEDAVVLARRLSDLLGDTSPIRNRTWTSVERKEQDANLRDVGWWFMQFSFLRNDLMHGRALGMEEWRYDDRSHIDLGEWYLRQAIKHTVANDGHLDILTDLLWRNAIRETHKMMREQKQQDESDAS
jgi:hypothetical protein